MKILYLLFLAMFIFYAATKINPEMEKSDYVKGIFILLSIAVLISSIICFFIGA